MLLGRLFSCHDTHLYRRDGVERPVHERAAGCGRGSAERRRLSVAPHEERLMELKTTSVLPTSPLGTIGRYITRVDFGAWAIGGTGCSFAWAKQDDAESVAAIHHAIERGVTRIGTAAVHGLGTSEQVVARALHDLPRALAERGAGVHDSP
jgi:Aldo/keto reductase family